MERHHFDMCIVILNCEENSHTVVIEDARDADHGGRGKVEYEDPCLLDLRGLASRKQEFIPALAKRIKDGYVLGPVLATPAPAQFDHVRHP